MRNYASRDLSLIIIALLIAVIPALGAGTVELRGAVHNLGESAASWNSSTFPGFYYDLDRNLGTETITFMPTGYDPAAKSLSDTQDANGNRGVVYLSQAQPTDFAFHAWGQYDVIGFLGERYFAAYENTVTDSVRYLGGPVAFLADTSKNDNMMTRAQLAKVLIDNNTEMLITSASPLKLKEGYDLGIQSVNANETKAIIELKKNGRIVDTKMIQPSITNAQMSDKTYYYRTSIGDITDIVQIAVHFKNILHGSDKDSATIDGIFQLSDMATPIQVDQQYDKMSIRNVDSTAMTIKMDNKDNAITLSKNKDMLLMANIHIKTADQAIIDDANPLRYYIYEEKSCDCQE